VGDALIVARRSGDIALLAGDTGATALRARFVELRAVTLRGTGEGIDSIHGALSAQALTLADPGRFAGADPCVLWRSPTEWTLFATSDLPADAVLRELAPGRFATACAIDQSAGLVAIELDGSGIASLLPRLIDASAVPRATGHGARARLGDIAVTILRIDDARAWLLAERSAEDYLLQWIAYAAANARDSEPR
jgi:heterotetrameric sarcosine oxidase gamma subunit